MLQSIVNDIKAQFRYGTMVNRLILVNFGIFLGIVFVKVFTPGQVFEDQLISYLALPSEVHQLIRQPWSILTHFFLHEGLWHIVWNMLMLFWFGRILGDLLGDNRILPLYLMGGLFGGLLYLIYANLADVNGILLGASGAVMSLVVAAAFVAPEYIIHLILIGPVRLKYVALVLFLLDIVMISQSSNTGGHFAHIGGAIFGMTFVLLLQRGVDVLEWMTNLIDRIGKPNSPQNKHMKVVYKQSAPKSAPRSTQSIKNNIDAQEIVDAILDKINLTGYESLTEEEKEILYRASKN